MPKLKDIVKRLDKTRTEAHPDLQKERQERDREVTRLRKEKQKKAMKEEKIRLQKLREEKDRRDLSHLMKEELMTSNEDMVASLDTSAAVDYEEDFM